MAEAESPSGLERKNALDIHDPAVSNFNDCRLLMQLSIPQVDQPDDPISVSCALTVEVVAGCDQAGIPDAR